MKRFTLIGILLLFGCATAFASVSVTNLHLTKNSQYTEFAIECEKAFEYSHQIVEATADKPYRIVVDIQDAVHALPQNDFEDLPPGSVTGIRTSQYRIDPESVVRVVLDVKGTLTYKVKKDGQSLVLLINTPNDPQFQTWSAVSTPQGTYAAQTTRPQATPAMPGNENSAPKPVKAEPAKENLQLTGSVAARVPDVKQPSKSEPVVTKAPKTLARQESEPATEAAPLALTDEDLRVLAEVFAGNEDTQPPAPAKPGAKSAVTPTAAKTQSQPVPAPPVEPAKSSDEKIKRTDSADAQQPPVRPSELKQPVTPKPEPPKTEKSALPETKAKKGAQLAKSSEAEDADMLENQSEAKSKPDAIREKYLAKSEGRYDEPEYDPALTQAYQQEEPLSDVERIRQKYRRGISFVQDDQDAARLQQQREQEKAQEQPMMAYDEYVPHREVVIYSTGGKRDPFSPLLEDADRAAERIDPPEVRSLRLIGVLQDEDQNRALFEDYNGFAYILQTGDRVKNGFLVSIAENHAVFQIRQYGWTRTVALELEEGN